MPAQGTWLECNGQSTAAYPALAAIVGANVPDYQGVFLRGYGSQTSTHYGTITHSSATLGVLQGDTIRNITGTLGLFIGQGTGPFYGSNYVYAGINGTNMWWQQVYMDLSRSVPTANENRPINKAVHYLIKAA